MRANRDSVAAVVAAVAVVAVVVLGFVKTRGPSAQRLYRTDQKRIQNLSQLANELNVQYNRRDKQLPETLDDAQKTKYLDPVTGQPPVYTPKPPNKYTLCATFSTDSTKEESDPSFHFWTHSAGSKCFELNAAEPVPQAPYFYY